MNNKINLNQLANAAKELRRKGEQFTMLGIGPMSETLIKATLELAGEKRFPVMLIASRNQVDSDEFGAGYVCGWSQKRFAEAVNRIAGEIGFDGLVYLCRDHGGPWQRDEERRAKLPVEEAMDIARRSYMQDMRDGFDLLHIDPTKDPFCEGVVPLELVLEHTVELMECLENFRKKEGLPEIAYEVGTEETNGGLTSNDAFEGFIKRLLARLDEKKIIHPVFVVGQTGTLTRLTENVGHYDTETAGALTALADKYGIGIKEHNGDYLRDAILMEHPVLGVDATNVAPEFGVAETRAYLELAHVEKKVCAADACSDLENAMQKQAVLSERWRKWMVGDKQTIPVEEILRDEELTALITDICGHYTYEDAKVKAELAKMEKNLSAAGICMQDYVIRQLKESIDRYAYNFGMHGLTDKILAICNEE